MDITIEDCTFQNRFQEIDITFWPIDGRPVIEATIKYTDHGYDQDGNKVVDHFYIDDLNVMDESDWPKITKKTENQLLEIAKDNAAW
jgi:hypothetical protein